jgi:hypothetical protein
MIKEQTSKYCSLRTNIFTTATGRGRGPGSGLDRALRVAVCIGASFA